MAKYFKEKTLFDSCVFLLSDFFAFCKQNVALGTLIFLDTKRGLKSYFAWNLCTPKSLLHMKLTDIKIEFRISNI